jgi:predicted metalloprotease
MRYDDFRRSDDIEDRRGDDSGGGGGGGIGLPMGGGGLGIGTIIVLGLISYAFGIDPRILIGGAEVLNGGGSQAPSYQSDRRAGPVKTGAPTDEMGSMISGILGEIDDRWSEIFQASGQSYTGPKIVLFRNATNGGRCGMAQSAMGPFYCPPEQRIFLDTGFFREVETRFHGCSGNACKFTAAYIIAHEAGHHIQNLLGILPRVTRLQQQSGSKTESNALQVKVELQADCLSGVWVNRESKKRAGFLEAGDIDAALTTASAIGDDTLQRQATGRVVPDSFTHGSAAQRKQWFMTGYQQGTVQACNTFGAGAL